MYLQRPSPSTLYRIITLILIYLHRNQGAEKTIKMCLFVVILFLVAAASSLLASGFSSSSFNTNMTPTNLLRRREFLSSSIGIITTSQQHPQPANAAIRDPKTGILLPSIGEIEASIPQTWDDESGDTIFTPSSFSRLDSSDDKVFYAEPRFVEHVDSQAVDSMTSYISNRLIQSGDSILDLCSSWTSHIAPTKKIQLKRVAGLGMNAKELEANTSLTEWIVQDLNENTNVKLPYESESFNVVLCQLSIDYLIHPLEVMREVSRVLQPRGKVAILISNRLFLTKAVGLWTGSDDIEHCYTVGSYLHYCGGGFVDIKAEDLSTRTKSGKEHLIVGDPLYVITAIKA